jgi:hypothetical protein
MISKTIVDLKVFSCITGLLHSKVFSKIYYTKRMENIDFNAENFAEKNSLQKILPLVKRFKKVQHKKKLTEENFIQLF